MLHFGGYETYELNIAIYWAEGNETWFLYSASAHSEK